MQSARKNLMIKTKAFGLGHSDIAISATLLLSRQRTQPLELRPRDNRDAGFGTSSCNKKTGPRTGRLVGAD
jgi:hypothetical protein